MRQRIVPWAIALLATISGSVTAQSSRDEERLAPEVTKLAITGVKSVDWHDLSKSINSRASKCRSILIEPFCLVSKSPLWVDKYYLDQKELERDVVRIRVYYWYKGYRETTVDTVVTKLAEKKIGIEFKVTEGRPTLIRKLSIAYDSTLINEKTRNRLTLLKANDPLDLTRLDTMRVSFQSELWDRGFGDAVIDTTITMDSAQYLADVNMKLVPNRRTTIGRLTITGNKRVGANTILNSLTFGTGDLYRQSSVLESQRNLYESNLFRLAVIDVPPQYDSVKNVNIDVTEAPMHEARIGPGLSTLDFLQVQGHYTAYNVLGGARRLDVDGTVGNLFASSLAGRGLFRDVQSDVGKNTDASPFFQPTYNASIDFKQPAFLQRPADQAGFGTFAHRTINPGVFIDQGFGGQATLTHVLAPRTPISINYRYEQNRVEASDVYFCMTFGVCDNVTIGALRSHQSLSPLTLTGFIDHSDQPFSPTKGYVARLDVEHASNITASDYAYTRAFFDGAIYGHKSQTQNVFSAHLRFGVVRSLSSGVDGGVLHPRKRFYAGGANSVRGFAESQLGPRILTIDSTVLFANNRMPASINGGTCGPSIDAVKFCDPNTAGLKNGDFFAQPLGGTSLLEGSVEYRMPLPLGETLRHIVGAVFVDGGVVGKGDIRGISSLGGVIRGTGAVTPGFGLRYDSPVGPIRVDFGINPNRSEDLTVVTAVADATGARRIVPLTTVRHYQQGSGFFSHLVLHFSIGEAY
ncbi:MAG TPA: BamA/TamA family outer membrane protein [Gemmatimonadaceae bacterium]|jgi:outer membrane protein insertion porin family